MADGCGVDDESQVMFAIIETALSLRLKSAKMRWRGHSLGLSDCFSKTATLFTSEPLNPLRLLFQIATTMSINSVPNANNVNNVNIVNIVNSTMSTMSRFSTMSTMTTLSTMATLSTMSKL